MKELSSELEQAVKDAEQLVEGGSRGMDLVPTTAGRPAVAKREMERTRQLLDQKETEIKDLVESMKDLMRREMAAAEAVIAPMQKYMRELNEGIWMVNLFLGRSEEIVRLSDGEPAPAEEPIHIRQLVLSMDEECAVAADAGGIDAMDVDQFDEWLTSDPAHLDQVLPETKGVVGLRARARNDRDYGNAFANDAMKKRNQHTYFLIRNGERLFRLWTDFSAGERMVPTAREFTDFFQRKSYNFTTREYDVEQLDPESRAFEKAEEEAEAHQRHYMRVGLVLQGLIERTTVFHPLPSDQVSFLDPSSHSRGEVVFILDGEKTLGTGREPFLEWQKRLTGQLEIGMRIVGNFTGSDFRDADEYGRLAGHSRVYPSQARWPESLEPHVIESKKGGEFVIRYDRGEIYPGGHYGYEPPRQAKTRASCRIRPEDPFVLPLDLVEADELREYLTARLDRSEYVRMFPLIKATIRVKEAEAAAEEPFIELLAAEISRTHNVSVTDAKRQIPALTSWWKRKNREHRPLVGHDDAKALREIVAEYGAQLELDRTVTPPGLLARLQEAHPEAILIARTHKDRHVVLEAENDEDIFVARHEYTKTGRPSKVDRWKLPTTEILRWRTFYESSRWKKWRRGVSLSDHLTGPEKEQHAAQIAADTRNAAAVTFEKRSRKFEVWIVPESLIDPDNDRSTDPMFVPREPATDLKIFWWKRTTGGEVKLVPGSRWDSSSMVGEAPWRPAARKQYRETRELFFEAPGEAERLKQMLSERKNIDTRVRTLRNRAWDLANLIEAAWLAKAEEDLLEAFRHEYGDMRLWEGHRKTLRDPSFPHQSIANEIGVSWVTSSPLVTGEVSVSSLAGQLNYPDELPEDLGPLVVTLKEVKT